MESTALVAMTEEELDEAEQAIADGLDTFVQVGHAFTAIREGKGYRLRGYSTFEAYCDERWHVSRFYAYRLMDAARVANALLPIGNIPETESQARELMPLLKQDTDAAVEVWQELKAEHGDKVTAKLIREAVAQRLEVPEPVGLPEPKPSSLTFADIVQAQEAVWEDGKPTHKTFGELAESPAVQPEPEKPSRTAALMTSESDKWNTPQDILERAVKVLGEIDLDPCSNSLESPNVPARRHYTEAEDGLARPWAGRVYMNPPYGGVIGRWVARLVEYYEASVVPEAIALVPARTDTRWFNLLRDYPLCFVRGRLHFSEADNGATFPSVAVYLGNDIAKFAKAFSDLGDIYVRYKP